MHVLAIETSIKAGSVAIVKQLNVDDKPDTRLIQLAEKQRTTQSIISSIQELLNEQGIQSSQLGLIAVSTGPGSFTGLRIGIMVAKTLAYAAEIPVLGVETFDILASQFSPRSEQDKLSLVIDAQRQQLFVQERESRVDSSDGQPQWGQPSDFRMEDREIWLDNLASESQVAGPGMMAFKGAAQQRLAERLAEKATFNHPNSAPLADALGLLALERFRNGEQHDFWALQPIYGRRSAAEEKHAEK